MFKDETLQNHLETSSTIRTQTAVIAEWNLNISENILQAGNYRYRPTDTASLYRNISSSFDIVDANNFYTGATDSDIKIDGGLDDDNETPIAFASKQQKEQMLYSLESCFNRFRPRSGINKLRFFKKKYTHFENVNMARRPRYYMSDKTDNFKYWTSWRYEGSVERGVANKKVGDEYYIEDAAPYVVYKDIIPTNRIVVKMQTHIGDVELGSGGSFRNKKGTFNDPFFGEQNKATPVRWRVQYLDANDNWTTALSFNRNSVRKNSLPIIGSDGYVELGYGLIVPDEYQEIFAYSGEYVSADFLPPAESVSVGTAYLVLPTINETGAGTFYIQNGTGQYSTFSAQYGWQVQEEEIGSQTNFVTDLTSPVSFTNSADSSLQYKEIQYIKGLRIVVETMNVFDSSLDLIELSPRLTVDLSDKVTSFSMTKHASDLGESGMPVGQLLASTGTLDLFDYDQAFLPENKNSIISSIVTQNLQVKFYEIISGVEQETEAYTRTYDYYVPLKTMYIDGFPQNSVGDRTVQLTLRDLFFYFESTTAPKIVVENASLSYAISLLLDSAGFSNYVFKRVANETDMVIPHFYVEPDISIAEVLSDLAVSTQSAMFFDEYNNLVVMSKNYMMPTEEQRKHDITLYGTNDTIKDGVQKNKRKQPQLANIISVASQENEVYNDGVLNYSTKYIQKSYSSIRQANLIDRDKTWIYKPSLLWEVSPSTNTKSVNEELSNQSAYSLSAIPLNSNLTNQLPVVINRQLKNNIIDFGEGVYWLSRYNGYFYANGEVIKYDAVEYSVSGLTAEEVAINNGNKVWITSVQEYQKYFAKLPFNGKIYPTGLVRIYTEPNYETVDNVTYLKNGPVAKHGRIQFGTGQKLPSGEIVPVFHNAGLSPYWSSEAALGGVNMDTKYLFGKNVDTSFTNIFSDTILRGTVDIKGNQEVLVRATITGSTGNPTIIESPKHDLNVNDLIYFTSSADDLPDNLIVGRPYLVHSVVDVDKFKIKTTSGTLIQLTTAELTNQSGTHSWRMAISRPNLTGVTIAASDPAGDAAKLTKTNHGLFSGQPIYLSGTMPSGFVANTVYIISGVPNANTFTLKRLDGDALTTTGTGTVTVTPLRFPAVFNLSSHRFIKDEKIYFTEANKATSINGLYGVNNYYVSGTGLAANRFLVSSAINGERLILPSDSNSEAKVHANLLQFEVDKRLVLPNVNELAKKFYVEKISGTGTLAPETVITKIDADRNVIEIFPTVVKRFSSDKTDPSTGDLIVNEIRVVDQVPTILGLAGQDQNKRRAKTTTRNGIIKNFMSSSYLEDGAANRLFSTQAGTIQSSALVLNGSSSASNESTPKFVTYVYKKLEDRFRHFGTRMRIVGKINNNETRGQSPEGSRTYYQATSDSAEKSTSIGGASGGIAVLLNPITNNGYFFELIALTENDTSSYEGSDGIHNIVFYKTKRNASATLPTADAIPIKLWGGIASIIADGGQFTGQQRIAAEEKTTVYDLAVEYVKVGKSLKFYLYVNDTLVATVVDDNPLPITNGMALFIRESSRVMFENVYALTDNYSQNTAFKVGSISDSVFGDLEINATNAFRKYSMSGMVQQAYLSGISGNEPPRFNMYFEEFGTIMREAAYMNVRYDKAYPALYAKLAPTFNQLKGYVVSGFVANAYGAEFLIFNSTDSALNLDSTSGNYLRILGVTFTQQSNNELTVDEYFDKLSDLSNPQYESPKTVISPQKIREQYYDINFSRTTYGRKQFSITSKYIQTHDDAEEMMGWLTSKLMKPRKSVGVSIFAMPTLQLGDIVKIDYESNEGIDQIAPPETRFVVYSIEYNKALEGPSMTAYLSEVK
jgi:hypothetical protein